MKVIYKHQLFMIFFCCIALGLNSCSDSDNSPPAVTDNSVEQTLNNLGVDTTTTPREDNDSEALPEDYTPLGSSRSFGQLDELAIIGIPLAPSFNITSGMTFLELDRPDVLVPNYNPNVLYSPDAALTPWATSSGSNPAAQRSATRADIDRDGLEELLVVYRSPDSSNIELQLYDDEEHSFSDIQHLVLSTDDADKLSINSGDFDADGYSEIIVGIVSGNTAQLIFINNDDGILSLSTLSKTLPQAYNGSDISLIIKSGNIDYDSSHEFVVIVNEAYQQSNVDAGTSRYFIFDDANNNHDAISNALIQSTTPNRTAIVADVSLGDIDGDNLDEMVFAGLTHYDPIGSCEYNYLLIALDDLAHDAVSLGASEQSSVINGGCSATARGKLRFVHINTPDLTGDGIAEVQANELIFSNFVQFPAWTPLRDIRNNVASIPQAQLFANDAGFSGHFSALNSSMIASDLTVDKRQDVVFYSQATNRFEVWGLSDPNTATDTLANEWRLLKSIAVDTASAEDTRPLLIPVNVNHDSVSISYDQGSYQLVFTEPVIIAALAAAPCDANLGQNLDACRTSYGTTESTSVTLEQSLTISAGVSIGVQQEFSDPVTAIRISEVSAKVKVSASLSLSHSAAYTYSESVTYETGPIEDTVIFTTIPYDVYSYTITSHVDPALIGTEITVSMPRSPITLQVERSFYNDNVTHGGPLINESVFNHSAGDVSSYPTLADKDFLASKYSTLDPISLNPLHLVHDIGAEPVGQGTGSVTQEINIGLEAGVGVGIGLSVEFEAEATLGFVLAGFSVGVSGENSLQIVHGTESTYTGTVSALPSSTFASNYYSWGLFTYIVDDHPSEQQFEVINYWIE
ncbi:MAG: VCBS repeat-containing protein [Gammaproteobacteria bacterium]|nr:VCBS repeat-containing protein [Gammaproteobacteria bacterium]